MLFDKIDVRLGDRMIEQIMNNYYFQNLLYIVIIVLIALWTINNIKTKDNIRINKYLNIKNINIVVLFKYLFLSFIIRIILERLLIYIPITITSVRIPLNILEIIVESITTCIFAPIFEEIIFRFWMYKKINKKFNICISIILTSIIFAILHGYRYDGLIILSGISLIWNYAFYKRENLIYPILLHSIHNIYAVSNKIFDYNKYWYILLIVNIIGYIFIKTKEQKK